MVDPFICPPMEAATVSVSAEGIDPDGYYTWEIVQDGIRTTFMDCRPTIKDGTAYFDLMKAGLMFKEPAPGAAEPGTKG